MLQNRQIYNFEHKFGDYRKTCLDCLMIFSFLFYHFRASKEIWIKIRETEITGNPTAP
jgi:hypothetical protein